MPAYDYECSNCGPFTEIRPMALSDATCSCPDCGYEAPRVFLTTPYYAMMDRATRLATSLNEKSAHEPARASTSGKHAPGCGCCSSKKKSKAVFRADGAKTFPSARPWMISH